MLTHRKRQLGLVANEFDRGQMAQIFKEGGIELAESQTLEYHIDQFLEYQPRCYTEGKISAGRLDKFISTIKPYREWIPFLGSSVEKIATKMHVDAYYTMISNREIAREIKVEHADQLFGTFQMFIDWLVDEEVLQAPPVCLQRKRNKRYTFMDERQKPETILMALHISEKKTMFFGRYE